MIIAQTISNFLHFFLILSLSFSLYFIFPRALAWFCLNRFDSIRMVMHTVTIIFISIKKQEENMTIFKLEHGKKGTVQFEIVCVFYFCVTFTFAVYCVCLSFSLDLKNETVRWENYIDQPKSICSEPCPIGHVHNHQDQCCWSCVKCREEFEFVKNDTCISCQPGWAPNERKDGCDKLKAEVIDWLSPWAYVSSLVSFFSFTSNIFDTLAFRICVTQVP